jgi:hypothetical protein
MNVLKKKKKSFEKLISSEMAKSLIIDYLAEQISRNE